MLLFPPTPKMLSRSLSSHKTTHPSIFLSLTHSFSSSPPSPPSPSPPQHPEDSAILQRLHHKDWLTPKEVTTLLNSLTHHSSALTLLHLYSSRKDFNLTEPFCVSLITRLARAKLLHPIQSLLQTLAHEKKLRRFSEDFFYSVIKLYAHSLNRIDKAVDTLYAMPSFRCVPSTKTFNFVLNLLVSARVYEVAHEVYASAGRLGVEVDACCLNILIKGLCESGKLEAAYKVFDEFPKSGLERNVRTFATLMDGLCEKGRVEEAIGLLEVMDRSGVSGDTIVYNVVIKGLRKKGMVEEGKQMLERMMRKGCYPNGSSYQEVLYGLLDAERFSEAKDLMERMILKERVSPSFVSYKVMIKGLCKRNLVEDVDWAVRQMVLQGFAPRMGMWKQIVKCMVSQEITSNRVSVEDILEDLCCMDADTVPISLPCN
ncbi:PREDICTED: pentatricopeptide repeat-containing protein At3g14580, mitochondrial [Lupinus angustifolius]|nr:PREDICTED: pentatricopeptide repeat-containing protein At3g14580, mitochondrial [Lupinus angustifolius]